VRDQVEKLGDLGKSSFFAERTSANIGRDVSAINRMDFTQRDVGLF
jgi:hypothetical protein